MVMGSPLVRQIRTDGLGEALYQLPNPRRTQNALIDLTAQRSPTEVDVEQALAQLWHHVARGGLVPVTLRASNAVVTEVDRGTDASDWQTFRRTIEAFASQANTTALLVERQLDTTVSGTAEPLLDRAKWRVSINQDEQPSQALMSLRFGLSRHDRHLLGPRGRHRELARFARKLRRPFRWAADTNGRIRVVAL